MDLEAFIMLEVRANTVDKKIGYRKRKKGQTQN
jgi:hypothetical protein